MLTMASDLRSRALQLAFDASQEKRTSTRSLTRGERAWLAQMVGIFEVCFGRASGVTLYVRPINRYQAIHERGGPCPAFIAAAATELAGDPSIVNPPERWKAAIRSLSNQKTVARRLQNRERPSD